MLNGEKSFTKGGAMKKAELSVVATWVKEAWEEISVAIVIKSFKKCSISNSMDGSEDDILYSDVCETNKNCENVEEKEQQEEEDGKALFTVGVSVTECLSMKLMDSTSFCPVMYIALKVQSIKIKRVIIKRCYRGLSKFTIGECTTVHWWTSVFHNRGLPVLYSTSAVTFIAQCDITKVLVIFG